MLASGRPDSAIVRARLQALVPRWVPTAADLEESMSREGEAGDPAGARRHSLPDAPRPVWKVDAAAARGLVSLALAATAGALVMVIVGWPRGEAVPSQAQQVDDAQAVTNVLVDPSASVSATAGLVVIDVDGSVRRPGVVRLPSGSRVIDAIKAAGGTTPHADTGALNLAEVLIDGQQVVVPSTRESIGTVSAAPGTVSTTPLPSSGAGTATVSLNSASAEELETLPGIGPVLAAAIVQWRTDNGGFTSIEQLQEVSGIGPATYADVAPLIRL
jgi:competence protein ComEA